MKLIEFMNRVGSKETNKIKKYIEDGFTELNSMFPIDLVVDKQDVVADQRNYSLPTGYIELKSISIMDSNDSNKYKNIPRLEGTPIVSEDNTGGNASTLNYFAEDRYCYQINGSELYLYEIGYDEDTILTTNGVTLASRQRVFYPNESLTNGLRIEYTGKSLPFTTANGGTIAPTEVDEDSYINAPSMLQLALIEFVKGELAYESGGSLQERIAEKEYHINKFKEKANSHISNLKIGRSEFLVNQTQNLI